MTLFRPSIIATGLMVYVMSAVSHHSFAPVYDDTRTITVSGVVTQFKFVNPHALMSMDVTDESGKVAQWTVEFAGRLNLSNYGWTVDTIKAGEKVTVTGNPTHTGSDRMFFRKLVRADGTQLQPGSTERSNALDEERRQRARDRDLQQQKQ